MQFLSRYRLQLAVVGSHCNNCRLAMNVVIAYLYVHAELRLPHDASLSASDSAA